MILAVIILLLLIFVESYVIYNLYKKYDSLEEEYNKLFESSSKDIEFLLSIRNRVMSQRSYLKQLDRRGAFESDDEVGYFFKELKKIIKDISLYFELEEDKETVISKNRSVITGGFDGD